MEQNKGVTKTTKQLVEMVGKLEPHEFIGVCKIFTDGIAYKPDFERI